MLDDTRKYFSDLLKKYPDNPSQIVDDLIERMGGLESATDKMIGVFSMCKKLGIRIVAIDYNDDVAQFVKRGSGKKSYIFLNSTSNVRRLRFDAATMLYCALRSEKNGKEAVTKSVNNHNLHRAKRFAATLLMPTKSLKKTIYDKYTESDFEVSPLSKDVVAKFKDAPSKSVGASYIDKVVESKVSLPKNPDKKVGDYKYLVKDGDEWVIPFKNIHYIADIYGVEFTACAKRILHSNVVPIKGVRDKHELKKRLEGPQASEATRRELIPEWKGHDYRLKSCLINNMHFPSIDTANEVVKEKIRVESVKHECVIEGVVSSSKGMDRFLHKYRVNPEAMKEEMQNLSVAQRIMIGHYETVRNLNEIPLTKFFVCALHAEMFKYAQIVSEEGEKLEFKPYGRFKTTSNQISNADFETDPPGMVLQSMEAIYYDIKDLLDNKDRMSNLEYIETVNYIARKFLVSHPFDDGNGRVSRLLMNYLFAKKGLPPFFINASKRKNDYIEALEEIGDKTRRYRREEIDFSKLNCVVIDSLIETEGIFFSARAMIEDPDKTIDAYKIKK